jgi:pyruvate,water dikinase
VGPDPGWIIPLARGADVDERLIGGKAAKLAQLVQAGFRVPDGFFITTQAYRQFMEHNRLTRLIRVELGRKPLASMRWEEIWDAALRIRSAYLSALIPPDLTRSITAALDNLDASKLLAVRSSAPGEDSAQRSFAGLHESVVDITGTESVLNAVRVVWASLWSDAALLYRRELDLDPAESRMAVVVQEMVDEDHSGVAFGRDPREPERQRAIVEAVPGPCGDLVDGLVDPDRWILDRETGRVIEWRAGEREGADTGKPILENGDLENLHRMLAEVESLFGWPPDTEWTGRLQRFTLLQARPITTAGASDDDQRQWYLSLRPGLKRLRTLAERVAGRLIPELEALGHTFASEPIEDYDADRLAGAIETRTSTLEKWQGIYRDDFIPFAHGVRQLGIYYNDAVRPDDPYEFVGLLRGERMVASLRNRKLSDLAALVREDQALREELWRISESGGPAAASLPSIPGGERFLTAFEELQNEIMDVAYQGERLADRPDLLLTTVLEMAGSAGDSAPLVDRTDMPGPAAQELERRLLEAVGPRRSGEAREIVAIGRLSWRLRDDDNVLIGRLESQLLRALNLAADRLREAGQLEKTAPVTMAAAPLLAEALRHPPDRPMDLPRPEAVNPAAANPEGERPRQLVGQPASPGLASGRARMIRDPRDLGRFRSGEVLVCDAIQPTMTHLVPLACAIIERRGGMLIHGAIIARELGIPCVNGVPHAAEILDDGEIVTVDGYLGIVTVGEPEFDLEEAGPAGPASSSAWPGGGSS